MTVAPSGPEVTAVGVVGAGGISRVHVDAWHRLGLDVVVFSIDGRAGEVAASVGGRAVDSLDDLLAAVQVVDVCVPTYEHPAVVAAAAAAGRHVVCEKPLAVTHDAAADMISRCAAAGVQLYPGQVVRYFPQNAVAKAAVDAGRIGSPAVLRLTRRGAAPAAPWFADPALSGGVIVDQMIHDIDYARWIAGEVETVWASVAGGDFSSQQVASVVLGHENGTLSQLTGGWGGPDQVFTTSLSLAGSAGLIEHTTRGRDPVQWETVQVDDHRGALLPDADPAFSPYLFELAEFLAAFRGGPTPRVTAADSLAALDVALAATASAARGEAVDVKRFLG
ncbi:Gfo/Idh/MocA family protein [Nakamurella endophytica]|uniref:Dehydrogenase n=1 Tax=Nakamurella endophytica TaxID=1748367 RepID=A0A917SV34_9ACTN|nr:Gfo/Idh/MocA family oxidoreductase [Nakamurella endophytica]GGL99246.1 dehydrogenase [Nakamurella endophytica]